MDLLVIKLKNVSGEISGGIVEFLVLIGRDGEELVHLLLIGVKQALPRFQNVLDDLVINNVRFVEFYH